MNIRSFIACVIWLASLMLASQIIPFVGPFVGLLLPLPLIYYLYELNLRQSLQFTGAAAAFLALASVVVGYPGLLMIFLEFGVLGLCLSELFKRKLSIGYTVSLGCGLMLLVGFILLLFSSISQGMGPFEMIRSYLENNLKASLEVYKGSGISEQEVTDVKAFGEIFINIILKIYPGLMIIGSAFVVWLNILFSRSMFRFKGINYPEFHGLDRWQAPEFLVWPLIVSGFTLFLPSGIIKSIAVNCLLVVMTVYLYQGISILVFFIKKFNVPHWLRGFIYFFIVIQQFLLALLALVGLFDQWFDFRKIHKVQQA